VASDTGDDASEDERRDDHANEAQEDVGEEVALRSDKGGVHAKLGTGQHGEEGPNQEGTSAR
jgi:hypothetical protein